MDPSLFHIHHHDDDVAVATAAAALLAVDHIMLSVVTSL